MTTDDAALPEQRHVQINSGDGAFVGRDHHGDINIHHEIDPQTRATLTRIGRIAPGLSQMLERALRDGVISPETASQLSLAARSINEDVAGQISRASRSINEDVANQLSHAAEELSNASKKLDKLDHMVRRLEGLLDPQGGNNLHRVATRLEGSLSELSEATHRIGNLKGHSPQMGKLEQLTMSLAEIARRVEARVTPPPPVVLPDREGRWRWLGIGVLLGIAISIVAATYS
ncbi:hypothetical protein ACFY3O_12060 [Streptomyces sp. NPDC001046]|uniref:hypothetical protein n=1 Tax=Streptomyces sp. NPDC001046 TaxID=3364543 RepID=UPI0036C76E26